MVVKQRFWNSYGDANDDSGSGGNSGGRGGGRKFWQL